MRLRISLKKILSVIATSAVIFNSLAPTMTVLAQTAEPTPTPTDIAVPTPDATIAPTDTATSTVTPDATPVDLTTPTPEVTPSATDLATPLPSDQPVVTQSPESNPTVQGPPSSGQPTVTPTITPTGTPSTPVEQGTLTETTINNIDLSGVTGLNGSISTNQADYSPTSLVLISGSGFLANKEYTINIVSTDQPPVNFTDQVKADSTGAISYAYQLDGNYRPNYTVYIKSGEVVVATVTFTDTGPLGVDPNQCQNGGVGNPLESCSGANWVTGNVNAQKAHWYEGDFLSYRIHIKNANAGTGSVTFSYDVTKSSKHAIDYLGSFDATETTGAANSIHANQNDPCGDVFPCNPSSPDGTVAITADSTLTSFPAVCGSTAFSGSQIPGLIKAWHANGLTFSYGTQNVGSGDCTTTVTVGWGSTPGITTSGDIVIAFGGHVATHMDWGTGNSAVNINGSPYHVHQASVTINGVSSNVGSQDLQLAAGAIIVPGVINIIKNTVGGNGTFNYTTGGNGLSSFGITTVNNTGSHSFTNLIPGTNGGSRTITETVPSGWSLTGLSCVSVNQSSTIATNLGTGIATISTLGPGDTVNCTYTNTLQNGTLTVQKTTIPALDPTIFSINATGSGTITGGGAGTVTDSTDKVYTVTAGTYSVSETVPTGWSQTGNTCSGVVVAAGGSASCLITNSKLPKLTVTKTLVPSNDTGLFNLKIDGTTDAANVGNLGTTGAQTLTIGGHTVSETAGTGTDLSNYTAVIGGDCAANGSITLAAGDNKTCTITNTRNTGTIELKKIWSGTAGQTTLNIGTTVGGSQIDSQLTGANGGTPLTTGANTVNTGTYYVSETGGLTNYGSVLGCTDNNSPVSPGTGNSLIVTTGHAVVCTFTNTRNQGTIELKKIWSGTAGQTTLNIGTVASGTDVASVQTGASGANPLTTGAKTVDTGTYYVSESGGLTNYSSVLGCTDNGQAVTPGTDSSLTVTTGHAIVCTYTNTRNTGTITIIKTALGGDGTFGYTIAGDTPLTPSFTTSGGTYTWGPTTVDTGSSYTVTETTLPTGWLTTSQSCTKDGGKTTFNGGVTFAINTGDNVVCSFTNTKLGTIIVKKVMIGGTDSFTFTGDVAGTISTSGGTLSSSNKMPKSFTSTEGAMTGWNLTSIVCDDTRSTTPSTGNLDTRTATFNVDAGETVTCTFTNTKIPTLTVNKVLSPSNDPGVFNLLINGQTYATNVGDKGSTGSQFGVIGSNTVGETAGTNTTLTDYTAVIGGDCAANGTITLAAGDNKTCTITNTRNTGAIKVNKFLDASGNGTFAPANPGIFTWSLDGSGTNAMGGTVSGINTGPHNVGESSVTDYHFVGWYLGNPIDNQFSCSNLPETSSLALPISVTVTNGGVAQINLCNARDTGTITVNKVVNPSEGDNGLFDLQIDGSTAGTGNDVGNGGTTGAITVITGSHYIGEVAGTDTKLADYTSSIDCNNDQSGQGTILRGVDVSAGENVVCTITNTRLNPQIGIVKTNNAGGGIGAGSTVTYTLTITNTGDVNFDNVVVTDLLPGGFTYVDGSTTGATFVPPQIGSKLTWNLGALAAGATATITYQAQTDSSLSAGNYQNFATCTATYNDGETQPCNQTNSTVTIGAGTNYGGNLVGQVLGASTELPGTGSPTALLIISLGLLGTGLFLGYNSKKGVKKHAKN